MDEHKSQLAASRGDGRSILLAVAAIGVGAFVAVLVVATRTRFRHMIDEFEISVSLWTSLSLSPVLPLVLVVISVVTFAKEWIPRIGTVANIWNLVVLCMALAALGVYLGGLFAPLLTLIDDLS